MGIRTKRLRYGPERGQFGVLRRQRAPGPPECVLVLVHGGSWRWPYNRWVMWPIARDAARRGFTVFNVEYRRLGRFGGGGGYPETFADVSDAVVAVSDRLPDAKIVLVGHSAGGHLALVTAARFAERVDGVVSMSGPTDLRKLSDVGSEDVDELVAGAPPEDRWSLTSPIEMLPTGVPTVCVHGDADTTVHPRMSIRYVDDALVAGDDATLILVPGENHKSPLLPRSEMWQSVVSSIEAWRSRATPQSR